jgi:hypothetical protein
MCHQGYGWSAAGSCSVRCPRQDSPERKRLQPNAGRNLKRKRTASDAILCLCFGYAVSSAQEGTGENRPGATWRSQRPAAVGRAGPFRPEEHTFFPSHSARRASFHHGKNDTVLSGIRTDRPARRRPAAAAARCAGRARGGRPVTGRGARMTGFDCRRHSPSRLRHCWQGHWRGRLHAEHMLERAGEPSETVIVARELSPWGVGGQDQAQCVYRSGQQADRTPSASAGCGGLSRCAGGTARARPAAIATRRLRHTHGPQGAHPLPAPAGEGGRVAPAARPATIATRRWRRTHGRTALAPAVEGGRVARAAQRVLVPPRARRAGGGTHTGRKARALRQRCRMARAARRVLVPPRSRRAARGTHTGRTARALLQRLLWRAVASRGRHSACSSRRDRVPPSAAHTRAARRIPSASACCGGWSRRAGGTARARPAAIATRRQRHTHGPQGAHPPPAPAGPCSVRCPRQDSPERKKAEAKCGA